MPEKKVKTNHTMLKHLLSFGQGPTQPESHLPISEPHAGPPVDGSVTPAHPSRAAFRPAMAFAPEYLSASVLRLSSRASPSSSSRGAGHRSFLSMKSLSQLDSRSKH